MVTVLRAEGLHVRIYADDHEPRHVHVIGNSHEALFNLNCSFGPVAVRANYGFPERDLSRIAKMLTEHLAFLCEEWRRIHDHS